MNSAVIKRSIVIAGHKTSVSLEDDFWAGLKEIAAGRQQTLSDLVAGDRHRALGRQSLLRDPAVRAGSLPPAGEREVARRPRTNCNPLVDVSAPHGAGLAPDRDGRRQSRRGLRGRGGCFRRRFSEPRIGGRRFLLRVGFARALSGGAWRKHRHDRRRIASIRAVWLRLPPARAPLLPHAAALLQCVRRVSSAVRLRASSSARRTGFLGAALCFRLFQRFQFFGLFSTARKVSQPVSAETSTDFCGSASGAVQRHEDVGTRARPGRRRRTRRCRAVDHAVGQIEHPDLGHRRRRSRPSRGRAATARPRLQAPPSAVLQLERAALERLADKIGYRAQARSARRRRPRAHRSNARGSSPAICALFNVNLPCRAASRSMRPGSGRCPRTRDRGRERRPSGGRAPERISAVHPRRTASHVASRGDAVRLLAQREIAFQLPAARLPPSMSRAAISCAPKCNVPLKRRAVIAGNNSSVLALSATSPSGLPNSSGAKDSLDHLQRPFAPVA